MKKIMLIGALALLAACGSSSNGGSANTATDQSSASTPGAGGSGSDTTAGPDDTISVSDFGDMPPQCIDLLSTFLKQIEPTVSKIDWETATLADFESLGDSFQKESDAFDTQSSSAGCNKYNLTGSDADQLKQVVELAAKEAPGTVPFLAFLGSLTDTTASADSVPADCQADIAQIETYLGKGTTLKDLTMTEVTKFGKLMTAVTDNCTAEESQAFANRDDVTAFISG
jgi:hypothetical protein